MQNAWLTLDSIPDRVIKAISLPDSPLWDSQFVGALLLLSQSENWEKHGTLTPEETAEVWYSVLLDYISEETQMIPPGVIMAYGGDTPPEGFLLCDGAIVSRETYSNLFSAIGTKFGAGNGTTTFQLPLGDGRVLVGLSNASPFNAIGNNGGAENVTLATSQIPSHNHTQDAHNHTQNSHNHTQSPHNHGQLPHAHTIFGATIGQGGSDRRIVQATSSTNNTATEATEAQNVLQTATNQAQTATNQATTATNQATGGGASHTNLQPYLVTNFIIKI